MGLAVTVIPKLQVADVMGFRQWILLLLSYVIARFGAVYLTAGFLDWGADFFWNLILLPVLQWFVLWLLIRLGSGASPIRALGRCVGRDRPTQIGLGVDVAVVAAFILIDEDWARLDGRIFSLYVSIKALLVAAVALSFARRFRSEPSRLGSILVAATLCATGLENVLDLVQSGPLYLLLVSLGCLGGGLLLSELSRYGSPAATCLVAACLFLLPAVFVAGLSFFQEPRLVTGVGSFVEIGFLLGLNPLLYFFRRGEQLVEGMDLRLKFSLPQLVLVLGVSHAFARVCITVVGFHHFDLRQSVVLQFLLIPFVQGLALELDRVEDLAGRLKALLQVLWADRSVRLIVLLQSAFLVLLILQKWGMISLPGASSPWLVWTTGLQFIATGLLALLLSLRDSISRWDKGRQGLAAVLMIGLGAAHYGPFWRELPSLLFPEKSLLIRSILVYGPAVIIGFWGLNRLLQFLRGRNREGGVLVMLAMVVIFISLTFVMTALYLRPVLPPTWAWNVELLLFLASCLMILGTTVSRTSQLLPE